METVDQPPQLSKQPKLIFPIGRGARGKSFLTRWLVERAQAQGRDIVVADVDRTNPVLGAYFESVVTPASADDRDVVEFIERFIERQIEERFDAIIDLGGGDLTLKRIARESELVSFLAHHNIMPVAIHVLGADVDDLAHLRDMEQGVFSPDATVVVLNEASVAPHLTPHTAFEAVMRDQPILLAVLRRGAKVVRMPRLVPAAEIDRSRLSFTAAEQGRARDGQEVLGPFKRQQIAIWRRQMEAEFLSIDSWLP